MARIELSVRGMDCAEEVQALRSELEPQSGVETLSFDLLNGRLSIDFDDQRITVNELIGAIGRAGLRAEPYVDHAQRAAAQDRSRDMRAVLTAASGVLLVAGLVADARNRGILVLFDHEAAGISHMAKALYLAATVAGAWFVIPKAVISLRRVRPDMNLLMCVAVVGALVLGEYFEAAAVAFLFALSLALESWSVGRARRAVGALLALSPTQARILQSDGSEVLVEATDVHVGATIVVRPGEKFPLDGRVTRGETSVNQASITGEATPVDKREGDEVFAGTVNEDGAVEIRATRPFADSTLARIVKLVGEAQAKRARSEQWVERFARIYTPAVMAAALALAVLPPLFLGNWPHWIYGALVLLVLACPCALVISTPVSIVSALASAARRGVLIKGGLYVEIPARLRAVAFDKTGTLTEGCPSVREVAPLSGHSEAELLQIAAAVESRSDHPLARAIVAHAAERGIQSPAAEGLQTTRGLGVAARIGDKTFWVGAHRFINRQSSESAALSATIDELTARGSSVVVVGEQAHICGYVGLADRVRPEARQVIDELRKLGIAHVAMLTGDNKATAEAIAAETGVDAVYADLLPQDKVGQIAQLVERYGQVAMLGDGINDAPALARASLGIAMGAAGTDAALETADVALMGDDLTALPWLVRHSRRTLAIIRQNIALAIGVKALFVALTLAGRSSLWGAIAADTGVSLLVVFNALRLLRA